MAIEVTEDEFEVLVDEGLRRIPRELLRHVDNVAIVVEDFNDESPSILGLYEGVALTVSFFSVLDDATSQQFGGES